jgi:phosphoribosylformylglycinamidine synthase
MKRNEFEMLWEIDVHPREGMPDREAQRVAREAAALGIADALQVASARGFLLDCEASGGQRFTRDQAEQLARELFVDSVVECHVAAPVNDPRLVQPPASWTQESGSREPGARVGAPQILHVLRKAGVMDPVALSAESAVADFKIPVRAIRTLRKYWLGGATPEQSQALAERLLANDAIEQVVYGSLDLEYLAGMLRLQGQELQGQDLQGRGLQGRGSGGKHEPFPVEVRTVDIGALDDTGLMRLSREGQLYLQLAEMQTIQQHFAQLARKPTDIELETIAQTWSEHCSHKTLAGRINYRDGEGERHFDNMLKETIFAATVKLRQLWGTDDWCVSVFRDNAGIVRFDQRYNVAFKVETHNHPSALEPYGGANTGIGGVIRDTMGTGMGAKPICNTDVFCFAPPDTPMDSLPAGVLHPQRVMHGVVEGVRDYGNRMGIPTVNGAVYFDPRYLGNPLVYCGNVGRLPREMSFKEVQPNDFIVSVGGRTGRDGIHGATFSSAELTSESETLSGGAVQIGNAIEEKMVLDVLLTARDRGLYTAITDCGAGGFSSAVGEMGEAIGAEVWLDRAPVKYEGLSYTEIWISEAQERMVLSVPESSWDALEALCRSEGVEASILGRFTPTGRLTLKYHDQRVGELTMDFLHNGRPPVIREAVYQPTPDRLLVLPESVDPTATLRTILGSLNVASKEWIVRQYDHEVQGGSVVKPLVGASQDGPGDAAVLRPVLDSQRALVIGCGMNPHYGDLDPYAMAASAIDEAVRNCVAVGADPTRIAILDNFCWGDCEKPETLGALVRAALACHDLSLVLETPFISGKDSLNNEFSHVDEHGEKQTIAIPATLLISALGQMNDARQAVTMDLKQAGNLLYVVGQTGDELGGSHFALVHKLQGGQVPTVDPPRAKATFAVLHQAIRAGLIRACHDLSEGGLAAAAAEMAFAGELGAELQLDTLPVADPTLPTVTRCFSESNTRFLCEVHPAQAADFQQMLEKVPQEKVPHAQIGQVVADPSLIIRESADSQPLIEATLADLKSAWQKPLCW